MNTTHVVRTMNNVRFVHWDIDDPMRFASNDTEGTI